MAVQAVLDPSPMHLIANLSPAPADVIWRNTYMPRWQRMGRAWTITIVITFLTVFWSFALVPLAGVLNTRSIHKVWPELADALNAHPLAASLVETQLPTLLTSLLFVAVPYLYDCKCSETRQRYMRADTLRRVVKFAGHDLSRRR